MGPLQITSEFCLTNARECLSAAAYTYTNPCSISSELAHGVVLDCGNARVMAFRGSVSARDWLTDFECVMKDAPQLGGKVHHGFADAVESITADLIERGNWVKGPMFVTGHSLGGALALLAAQVLERAGFHVTAVYTFGGPRTGNGGWAHSYDALLGPRTFRLVNEEDIVPRVPGWLMGYRHVGEEVFLPSAGGLVFEPSMVTKLISDAIGTWQGWKAGRVDQLADHAVAVYQGRVAGLCAQVAPEGIAK